MDERRRRRLGAVVVPPVKLVRITWLDSAVAHNRPWIAEGETISSVECVSVGWLMSKGKRDTVICQSVHDGGQRGNVLAIPTCSIVKMKRVR